MRRGTNDENEEKKMCNKNSEASIVFGYVEGGASNTLMTHRHIHIGGSVSVASRIERKHRPLCVGVVPFGLVLSTLHR